VQSYLSRDRPPELGLSHGSLRACGARPNCVGSENNQGDWQIAALPYLGDRAATEAALDRALASIGCTISRRQGDYWHAMAVSRLFRFIDDVELRFDDAAKVVHVRSASRVGYSDLGANRRRIESLREALR
jgi:uncharacterized protein (DUF1499 family)